MKRTASRFTTDLNDARKAGELGFNKVRIALDENLRRDYVAMEFRANSTPPNHPALRHRWPGFGLKSVAVHPELVGSIRDTLEKAKITVTGAKAPKRTKARASRRRA